jgi:hypothetical protein
LNRFSAIPEDTFESSIQAQFFCVVEAIASRLGVELVSDSETKIIVGGILTLYEYDVRSKCGPHFLNDNGAHSEAKTRQIFGLGGGIQVIYKYPH